MDLFNAPKTSVQEVLLKLSEYPIAGSQMDSVRNPNCRNTNGFVWSPKDFSVRSTPKIIRIPIAGTQMDSVKSSNCRTTNELCLRLQSLQTRKYSLLSKSEPSPWGISLVLDDIGLEKTLLRPSSNDSFSNRSPSSILLKDRKLRWHPHRFSSLKINLRSLTTSKECYFESQAFLEYRKKAFRTIVT